MNLLRKLFSIFNNVEKRKIGILQIYVVFVSIIEVAGFSALAPFLSFVGNPQLIEHNQYTSYLYNALGLESHTQFIVLWGVLTAVLILLSNLLIMFREYLITDASLRLFRALSLRLKRFYLYQEYTFHTERNSNQLINNFGQLMFVINSMLIPLLNGIGRLSVILIFLVGIIMVDPILGLVLNVGVSLIYLAFFLIFRRPNIRASNVVAKTSQKSMKILSESFRGIKEIKISHLEQIFIGQYSQNLTKSVRSQRLQRVLVVAPRYGTEGLLFSIMTFLILFMFVNQGDSFIQIITKLSFVAIAGYKIMPKLSDLYSYVTAIQGGVGALELIRGDLLRAKRENVSILSSENQQNSITLKQGIHLKDIQFQYAEDRPVLKKIDVYFGKNKTIGIVGTTGTGKTTLVNILLGLLKPSEGSILIDGRKIGWDEIGELQKILGYVPQEIFILDASIARNVAFGIKDDMIDRERVIESLKLAAFWNHVDDMPNGIDEPIGEGGARLSGGQRQRLGIARALYRGADILVFDEATSALDSSTEKQVMSAINDISHKRTVIIIAHRINTLKKADSIVVLKDGYVEDSGSYNELIERCVEFRHLSGDVRED